MVIVFLLVPCLLSAQNKIDTTKSVVPASAFIQKDDTLINIKFSVFNLDQRFKITGDDFHYDIQPNFTLKTKIFFSYRFLSFAVAFAPGFIPGNSDNDIKGKTKSFSLNMNIITKHWVQYFQFNRTKGFYLSNTADFKSADWSEGTDPYIQFPELKVLAFRGATSYLLNPRFSLKAVLTQTEVQKKSAGSFMPSLIYSLLITDDKKQGEDQTGRQQNINFELLATSWYMHTFVIKKHWFVSAGVAPAVGYSLSRLKTFSASDFVTNYYHNFVFKMNEQASVGFNTHRFFTGAVLVANQTFETQGGNPIKQQNLYTTFHIYVGYRFGAPRFIRKTFDWAEGLVHKEK